MHYSVNKSDFCSTVYIRRRNEHKTLWIPKYQSCYSGVFMYFTFSCLLHIVALNTQRIRNEYRFRFESMRWLWISWSDAGKAVANKRLVRHQCLLLHSWSGLICDETYRGPTAVYLNVEIFSYFKKCFLLLLSVGLPVANAPDVLQPYGWLYYPWCSNSHHQSSS